MNTFPQTVSVQDLQKNYRKALDLTKSSGKPLFILKNNKAEAVVIDMESWKTLVEKLQAKELKTAIAAIQNYKKEKKTGKLKKLSGSLVDLM